MDMPLTEMSLTVAADRIKAMITSLQKSYEAEKTDCAKNLITSDIDALTVAYKAIRRRMA